MSQQTVYIFWTCLCRWNPERYTEEEITCHVDCFVSVRYLLTLYYLEKILPEAKKGVPVEKILAVLKPNYEYLTAKKVRAALNASSFVKAKRRGFVLERAAIQKHMGFCQECGKQIIFDQPGCQNPRCPKNKKE